MSNNPKPRERVRQQSSRIPVNFDGEYYTAPGASPVLSYNPGVYAGYGTTKQMTDIIGIPFIKGGPNYVYHPMSSLRRTYGGTPGSYSVSLNSNGAKWEASGLIIPWLASYVRLPSEQDCCAQLHSLGDEVALQQAASTKCWANRGVGGVNNWENIFQLRKTLDELRHPFRNFALWSDRWVSTYEARVRKLRGSRKQQVIVGKDLPLDTYAGAWLQYRYGLRLLIKDVVEVLAKFDGSALDEKRIYTARGLSRSVRSDTVSNGTFISGAGLWTSSYTKDEVLECRATSHDEYVLDLLDQIGLSGRAVLTVGWEVIPYSFVADWIVNVQDFLNASIPTPTLRHIGATLSTKCTTVYTGRATCIGGAPGYSGFGSEGTQSVTQVTYRRGLALNEPTLQIQPDFRLDTLTRAADAVALAYGALTRAFGVKGRIHLLTQGS